MLFGQVTGQCPRHGFVAEIDDSPSHPARGALPSVKQVSISALRPPDLIIQDELHLISGPLGTLVGLYETAVDELCTWKLGDVTVRPKVIASTATIRQAQDQVKALFVRGSRSSRRPGSTSATTSSRSSVRRARSIRGGATSGSVRRASAQARPDPRLHRLSRGRAGALRPVRRAVDPWMTPVGYFNSMRELGGMRRLVDDDVRSRLRRMDERGLARRNIDPSSVEELTSRKSAPDIPHILDRWRSPSIPRWRPNARRSSAPARGPIYDVRWTCCWRPT